MFNADLIKNFAPSVFTQHRHPDRTTDRYVQIPTTDVLDMFEREGWITVKAAQARSVTTDGRTYRTHTLRLRHVSSLLDGKMEINGTYPEIVIRNSHDGASTLRLMGGLFRLICSNGLMVGIANTSIIRHKGGNVLEAVKEGGVWVVKEAQRAQNASIKMNKIMMDGPARIKFVHQVSEAIAGDAKRFSESELLVVRRDEDAKDTLWNVFNRAQETLVRGGMRLQSANGRPSRSRAIINADRDSKVNSALWGIAEKWAG
jgi:hypothetical protein